MADMLLPIAVVASNLVVSSDQLVNWRFTSLQQHEDSVTTKDILELEFVNTQSNSVADNNLVWSAPTCSLSQVTGQMTYLKCTTEGVHSIDLNVKGVGNKTRMIKFTMNHDCFNWYIKILVDEALYTKAGGDGHTDGAHQKLRVWIINDLQATNAELDDTASVPSLKSRQLSVEYYILGQRPAVTRMTWSSSGTVEQRAVLLGFDQKESYWMFELVTLNTYSHVRAPIYSVSGMHVALYDCFVKERVVVFHHRKYPLLSTDPPRYYMMGGNTHSLRLKPDPCHANVATVIVRNKVYITQDDFASITLLPAPQGMNKHFHVLAIGMMFNYIVVLGEYSDLYYLASNESQFKKYDIPDDVWVHSISSQDWCIEGLYNNAQMDLLAMTDRTNVWISNNLQAPEKLPLPMQRLQELAMGSSLFSYDIQGISMDIHPGRIGIAIQLTIGKENKVVFATHDLLLNTWELAPFWVDFGSTDVGKISFYFLGLAKSSFYFWNERSLFYSYDESQRYGLKNIYGCSNQTQLVDDADYIRDVIVSKQGDISILLNTNQIIFGKVKQKELVMFDIFNDPQDMNTVHWFDELNRLWFIKVYANNSVEKVRYPVRDELQAVVGFDKRCPYRYFVHSVQEQVYLLDKLEEWKFWAFLVYKQEKQNTLDLLFTDTHGLIEFSKNTEKKYISGVTSENTTITFKYKKTNQPSREVYEPNTNSSVAILELRPRRTNLLCKTPNSAVAYMSVGCPNGRHLRVQLPEGEQCSENVSSLYPNGYTISAGLWANLTTGRVSDNDKHVYVPNGLGCPITVENEQPFRPVLQLYDYDRFIKVVEADYILWEVNGRVDYAYTLNMEQILCMREAQTWSKMRELSNYTLPPDELWTSHNYMHCFSPESDDSSYFDECVHNLKYEILNYSSPNRITFNHDYSSLHVLKVKVVDPNYSFCNLSTTFAVKIDGIVLPRDLRDIAATNYAVLTGILLSLMATYIWFHRQAMGKQAQTLLDDNNNVF